LDRRPRFDAEFRETSSQKEPLAFMPARFSAGGLREASRHEQDDRMDTEIVRAGDDLPNPLRDFRGIHGSPVRQVDFLRHDEPLLALLLD
jgi:hypothetical protein